MRVAWFDASAGASGDMILGALVDAGASLDAIGEVLATLPLTGYRLSQERVSSHGVAAARVTVTLTDDHPHERRLSDVLRVLDGGRLPDPVRTGAERIFRRLADAEAKVHGTSVEAVHFHEVGAVDAIVDVVGAMTALHLLGIEDVTVSPLPITHGWVTGAHGRMPVPAWATMELLTGVPTRPLDLEGEVLTPTGAAILTTLATSYAPPAIAPERIGYGAGSRDFGIANVLRVVVGVTAATPWQVAVIEANIDDMNPEWYEQAVERLFEAGALDVTLSPLQMKKGRPGVLLRVVGAMSDRETLTDVILRETTSLGVRWFAAERECLAREWCEVTTDFGPVRVKIGRRNGEVVNIAPEYESCRAAARGASLAVVYAAATEAARRALAAGSVVPDKAT